MGSAHDAIRRVKRAGSGAEIDADIRAVAWNRIAGSGAQA
jgi:hypothetical protein